MNKNEFLDQLSLLLSDISYEERNEALNYYKEYIEDAGPENEDAVLKELGSPKDIASQIKDGLSNKSESESSRIDFKAPERFNSSNNDFGKNTDNYKDNGKTFDNNYNMQNINRQKRHDYLILAIIAIALISPLVLPFVGSLIKILLAAIAIVFGLAIGFGAASIACLVASIIIMVVGIVLALHSPLIGFALIGSSFIVVSIGLLFLALTVWYTKSALPAIVGFVRRSLQSFNRKNKEAHV